MTSVVHERISPEEYLRQERLAESKSEYDDGVVYAMSGASEAHNALVAGLVRSLGNRLSSHRRVYPSDLRVRIQRPTRFFYPDVTVVCGERRFADDEKDVLLNPLIVFEILSETTDAYDRGRKFAAYQKIESLQEYVLVSQDRYLVEHFRRDGDHWLYVAVSGSEATLPLAAAGCELPLREIYYQVDLSSPEE
jgi:Uma2 family endonuclease